MCLLCFFFFKQKTAYEMRISDWSSDVCSSDLVLRGRAAAVDGIVFQNMRVPDANGAGIRLERGNLEVANSLFRNSEQGILTADDTASEIRIDRSTFQHLRSEEHTSELQSLMRISYAVFCLKKKKEQHK